MTTTNFKTFNQAKLFTEQDRKNIQKAIKSAYRAQAESQRFLPLIKEDLERGVDYEDYNVLAEALFALYEGRLCDDLSEFMMELLYCKNFLYEINAIMSLSNKIKKHLSDVATSEEIAEETQVVEEQVKDIKITKLEEELLHEIMSSEADGLGMGYSSFDGLDIDNKTKGVLSSLIKKDLVYDSTCGEEDYTMYCTYPEKLLRVIDLDLSGYNLEVLSWD